MQRVLWRQVCGTLLALALAVAFGTMAASAGAVRNARQETYCPDVVVAIYWAEQAWLSCIEAGGGSACYDSVLPVLNELRRILDEHGCTWDR